MQTFSYHQQTDSSKILKIKNKSNRKINEEKGLTPLKLTR